MGRRIRQRRKKLQANNSLLLYEGNVSLKLKIKDKLYDIHTHNEGLISMFKLIAFSITGQYTKEMYLIPYGIQIMNAEGTIARSEVVELSSKVATPQGVGYASRLTALIKHSQMREDVIVGDYICLLTENNPNTNKREILAHVKLTQDVVTALNDIKNTAGVSGQIEWVIQVTNGVEAMDYETVKRG